MNFTDVIFYFLLGFLLLIINKFSVRGRIFLVSVFSVFFYGSLNFRFLIPLFICISADFILTRLIDKEESSHIMRRVYFVIAIGINVGILFFYKYLFQILNFSSEVFHFNLEWSKPLFPIGVSFYIFQSLSYIIDVYKKRIPAVENFFLYIAYVTFFPQLILGPIEKGHSLIPQLKQIRFIGLENSEWSICMILYGLFKKVCVGDVLGLIIDQNLVRPQSDIASIVLISLLTTFRVYADFSAYSDIARGLARLLNIDVIINFYPFFNSRNVSDFWSKWHLSLTTWVREYLFPAFLGKRSGILRYYWALMLSFLVIGVWHGAQLNWLLFGVFHGVVVISYRIFKKSQMYNLVPSWTGYAFMIFFYFVCGYLHNLGEFPQIARWIIHLDVNWGLFYRSLIVSIIVLLPLFVFDSMRIRNYDLFLLARNRFVRFSVYTFWYFAVLLLNHSDKAFVYYQF